MRIGVIGGGAAATSLLDSLVRNHDGRFPLSVTVFEAEKQFGPGRAYQPDSPAALVNQPARHMSVRFHQPEHFVEWLRERYSRLPDDPHFFVSRTRFGQYLEDSFHRCVRDGVAKDIRIRTAGLRAMGIRRDAATFAVATDDGQEHGFDAVFVCTGSSEPVDVYGLSGSPGFHPDAYPLRTTTAAIARDGVVAVLGSGLSAVDVVLDLARRGHRGPIRVYSRHGFLPGVRNPEVAVRTRVATPQAIRARAAEKGHLTVGDVGDLIARELAVHGLSPEAVLHECQVHRYPEDRLRRHLAAAGRGDHWQAVLAQITGESQIEDTWSLFDDDARREFQRDWHAMAVSLWSPMPLASARTLVTLLDRGRLEILRGIATAAPNGAGFRLSGRDPSDRVGYTHRADHIVNTIRPPTAAPPSRAADFLRSLVDRGLAEPHSCGGLRVDLATNQLRAADGPVTGLYALGQVVVGELHAATSNLSMIARRAEDTARALLDRWSPRY